MAPRGDRGGWARWAGGCGAPHRARTWGSLSVSLRAQPGEALGSLRLARRPPGWADPKQKGVQAGMGAHDVAQPGSRHTHGFGGTSGTCSCHLWETPEGIWGTLGHAGSCTSAFCRGDGHQAAWGRGLAVPGLTPQSPAPTAVGLIRSHYLPRPLQVTWGLFILPQITPGLAVYLPSPPASCGFPEPGDRGGLRGAGLQRYR